MGTSVLFAEMKITLNVILKKAFYLLNSTVAQVRTISSVQTPFIRGFQEHVFRHCYSLDC